MYNEPGGAAGVGSGLIGAGGAAGVGGLAVTGVSVLGLAVVAVTLLLLGVVLVRVASTRGVAGATAPIPRSDPFAALADALAAHSEGGR